MEKEFGVIPYLVDISIIRNLFASQRFELIETIQNLFPDEIIRLDNMYYLEEVGLTTSDVLKAYLAGEMESFEEQGHAYVFLTEILCKYFGKQLPNAFWYPSNFEYELYEALEPFFELPIPLQIPENDDFTFYNLYFPLSKILDFEGNFNFEVMDVILAQDEEEFQQKALEEFKGWFNAAISEKKDVILFVEALTQ